MRGKLLIFLLALSGISSGCSLYTRATLHHQYKRAIKQFDAGQYGLAAASFESLEDRYPAKSPEREEIIFLKSRAHYYLKNYHDASETIKSYIAEYPAGKHQTEAAQDMATIAAAVSEAEPVAEDRLQEARDDLEKLKALEKEHPNDPRVSYHIGNLYYELGDYKKAGIYYFTAQAIEAAYKEKDLIQKRLIINENGEPEALTPAALRALEVERNPLVIFDQMTYYQRQNTDAFSARQVFQNITGKVRNQGSETLRNVEIEVRFLNSLNQVLDFQTIRIGTLRPNDVRPFLAQASRYDHILNISRVEVFPRSD